MTRTGAQRKKKAILGLDVGTTGTKALITGTDGIVLAKGYQGYSLISDGNKVEQNADDWISACIFAVREALRITVDLSIDAISLSTQGGSTVMVDEEFRPVGNAWTWMDGRSAEEVKELADKLGEAHFYNAAGWKLNACFDPAKIMHFRKSTSKKVKYLTTLEYVNYFLAGKDVIDPGNAAIRQLYNIKTGEWDDDILRAAGASKGELPQIKPTGEYIGGLTEYAAEKFGLAPGIPVYNGGHDQYCASIGSGALSIGDMLLSTGTAWVVMGITREALFTDTFIAPGPHPIKGLYGAIASLACSGASLQWYKDNFLEEGFDVINYEIEKRYGGKSSPFFYPYLTGAGYPVWRPSAKGVFAGFTLDHGKFDFAGAIMEGVAFGLKRTLADFAENGAVTKKLKIMGGAANSEIWKRIISAVADIPMEQMRETDTCALGAAMIAAVNAGIYENYEQAAQAFVKSDPIPKADIQEIQMYSDKYREYIRMWDFIEACYK